MNYDSLNSLIHCLLACSVTIKYINKDILRKNFIKTEDKLIFINLAMIWQNNDRS